MSAAFNEFMAALPPGHAARLMIRGADLCATDVAPDELRAYLDDPQFVGTLCDIMRPGHGYFSRHLELVHFPVRSAQEPLLVCMMLRWQGLTWSIHSVPRRWTDAAGYPWRGEPMLRHSIEVARLRAVSPGWTPAVAGRGVGLDAASRPVGEAAYFAMGFVEPDFPMRNLLYLENAPGHLVYRDPVAARAQEEEDLRLLMARQGHVPQGGAVGPVP